MKTKQITMCSVCAAVICALAPLAIPLGPIPITLATFAVILSALILGGRYACVSVGIYLLLGVIGVPVFAGYLSGVGVLIGPTGGFLVGYIPMAFLIGAIYFRFKKKLSGVKKTAVTAGAVILGELALYACGTAWFCYATSRSVIEALTLCVVPYLPGDVAKAAVAMIICPFIEKAIGGLGAKKEKV